MYNFSVYLSLSLYLKMYIYIAIKYVACFQFESV